MIIKASGRSALILTAGVFVLFANPAMATDGDDSAAAAASDSQAAAPLRRTFRHVSHHRRHYAHRRLHAVAKADDDNKAAPAETAANDSKATSPTIPPAIANANAQMLLAGAQITAAAAIPPGTDTPATAPDRADTDNATVVAAADQLSASDRTLQEGNPTTAAATNPPPEPAAAMTGESSAWDQSSLIGKIFIGFGALLTVASAARMFLT